MTYRPNKPQPTEDVVAIMGRILPKRRESAPTPVQMSPELLVLNTALASQQGPVEPMDAFEMDTVLQKIMRAMEGAK